MLTVVYGIDTSCTGHVAWCKCGWRSLIEADVDKATEEMVLHRTREHAEGRTRVERRLGLHLDHPSLEATDELATSKPKRQRRVSPAAIACGERIRRLAHEMEAGRL